MIRQRYPIQTPAAFADAHAAQSRDKLGAAVLCRDVELLRAFAPTRFAENRLVGEKAAAAVSR